MSVSIRGKCNTSALLFIVLILSTMLPLVCSEVPLQSLALFALWLFLGNYLPGAGLLGLAGRKITGVGERVLALALGISAVILGHLLSLAAGNPYVFILLIAPLAVFGIYSHYSAARQESQINIPDDSRDISWGEFITLVVVLIGINIILYSNYYQCMPLPGREEIEYYLDIPWHLGNIASLSLGWFPQDFRLSGFPLRYHFFAYAWMAALKNNCDLSSSLILLRLYPAFLINLLVLAVWHTGRTIFSRPSACFALVLTLLAGNFIAFKPYNLFLNNLMYSPTYLLAMLLFFILIGEILTWVGSAANQNIKMRQILPVIFLMAALAGAKGPFLPVLLGGLFMLLLVQETRRHTGLLFALGLLVFIVAYLLLYRGGGGSDLAITSGQLIYNTQVFQDAYEWLRSKGSSYSLYLALIYYFFTFLGLRMAGIAFALGQIRRSKQLIAMYLLLGISLAGLAGGYLLETRDNSQYYFIFAGMAGLNLLTAALLGYSYSLLSSKNSRVVILVLILALMYPSFIDTRLMVEKNIYAAGIREGLSNKSLTPGLYEGLNYLRNNAPPQALVAGRRFYGISGRQVWFYYSAFSEHRMVLEGWEFMPSVRYAEAEQRHNDIALLYHTRSQTQARSIVQKYKIDYLIADKKYPSLHPHCPLSSFLKPVFNNNEVTIYQVIK